MEDWVHQLIIYINFLISGNYTFQDEAIQEDQQKTERTIKFSLASLVKKLKAQRGENTFFYMFFIFSEFLFLLILID